jgi:hypothetical protein
MQGLEDLYGPRWCQAHSEQVMYDRRKVIIDEIRRRQDEGKQCRPRIDPPSLSTYDVCLTILAHNQQNNFQHCLNFRAFSGEFSIVKVKTQDLQTFITLGLVSPDHKPSNCVSEMTHSGVASCDDLVLCNTEPVVGSWTFFFLGQLHLPWLAKETVDLYRASGYARAVATTAAP